MELSLVEPSSADWSQQVSRSIEQLRQQNTAALFPVHFLEATLPRIGGALAILRSGDVTNGIGFLFPCPLALPTQSHSLDKEGPQRAYTMRYHTLAAPDPAGDHLQYVAGLIEQRMPDARIVPYDPSLVYNYEPTYQAVGEVNIGRPSSREAALIQQLQAQIWGSSVEFLYPTDIHSLEFHLGASLVARVNDDLAGFLFGFYSYREDPLPGNWKGQFEGRLQLESQAMGVLPQFRGMRIGNLLKRVQADQAWQQQIDIVHWTADPLQYPNAALNFGLLRAVAYEFHPDYYPFRNQLNRVPASRLGITWLVGSKRVREIPQVGSRAAIVDLDRHPEIRRLNQATGNLILDAQDSMIAIEIPRNWTELQQTDIELAAQWRAATDKLFAHYLGASSGKYLITGVGATDVRYYLVAEFVDDQLWSRLESQ